MNTQKSACDALLSLLSNALFDADLNVDWDNVDLEAVFKEAKAQTVAAIAFDKLPCDLVQKRADVYRKWQEYALKVVHNNITQLVSNAAVEKMFKDAGIPICTIKGFACASYYPEPNLRQMGDIDFLIPKAKREQGKQLMLASGFVCADEEEEHDFHIAFKKGPYLYEMHESVTTFLDKDGYIEKYLENVVDTAEVASLGMANLCVPDRFVHGLIMLLHMQRHMISGGGVGLRHLCDWAVFVNTFESREWCELFEEKLKKINIWKFAATLSKTASMHLHMPEQEWFAAVDSELAEQLLDDIVIGGNFGQKDVQRYRELFFVERHHQGGVGFFDGWVQKVYWWSPFFKKHKIFLPFGMIAYLIRMAALILFGKKNISVMGSAKSGRTRNRLYKKLFNNKK